MFLFRKWTLICDGKRRISKLDQSEKPDWRHFSLW